MAKFNVGDEVSIRGQANSKLTITGHSELTGKYTTKTGFGTKGGEYYGDKLVPFGENTGKENEINPAKRNYNEKGIVQHPFWK